MQPTEKYRADLDLVLKRAGGRPETQQLEALRVHFLRSVRGVPEEVLAALFASFLERWNRGTEKAMAWLASVGSILLLDYDGYPHAKEDWEEIRDALSLDAGELDLDILEYALALVVDHGAI
jgi:hypothetical protein